MTFVPFSLIHKLNEENDSSFFLGGFQYDSITDSQIEKHLKSVDVSILKSDWMENDKTNHAERIAALVKLLHEGKDFPPVEMELSEYNHNLSYVIDGHHRIRALQFVKAKGFKANFGGFERLIKEFKKLCKETR